MHEDIQNMHARQEKLIKEYQDQLLHARLKALDPDSGPGGSGAGRGRKAGAQAAAAPPLPGQYLLSNEDQRAVNEEPCGFGSQLEYSSDDQAAFQNGSQQQLVPWLPSSEAAEDTPAKQTKSKRRSNLNTIAEEDILTESLEITPQPRTKTPRKNSSKRTASVPEPPTAKARREEAPAQEMDETYDASEGDTKPAGRKTSSRKRSTTEGGDRPLSAAKKKRK
jgi:hypothetical protein